MPDRLLISPLKRPFPGEQEALRLVDLSDVSGTIGSGSIVVFQDAPTFTGLVTFGGKIQADAGITAVGALSIFEREDSADNTILSVVTLRRTTSAAGNGAAGLGAALLFELENDGGGTVVSAGRVTSRWTSPVAAVETSLLAFETRTGGGALTEHWQITGAGHFLAAIDNTRDIGAAGATRPRTGYFGTSVIVGDTVTINSTQVLATGALTIDPTTDLLVEATDNRARAFAVAEGAQDYLVVSTLNAGASLAFGNATTNPTFSFIGGALSLTAPTGGGAAFVLGTVAHFIESSHAAEAGSTIRNPGPLRWRARTWETTGGTSTTQTYLAFGTTVDAITAATGVPTSATYRWMNVPNNAAIMRLVADSSGVGALITTGDVTIGDEVIFTDAAQAASAVGRLRRTGTTLTWFDTAAREVMALSDVGYGVRTAAGLFAARTLTGTANQVIITNGDGTVGNPVFSLPQSIHTGASPTFSGGTFTGDLTVQGNFTVQGAQHTIEGESVLFEDNHLYLNKSYETVSPQTGGLVVNYLPTATNDTVAATGFVAGVASVSNPTVITAGSATFAAGDFIQISGAANVLNDGLFEVLTHTGTTLTIRGIGVSATLEDFTQNQFVASTTVQGTIRKVTISILRAGTDGLWEASSGAINGLGFIDLVNLSASQNLSNKTLVIPIIADFSSATHNHQAAAGGGQLDHGLALTGLDGDDHTQYALLAGRSGGQTLTGGTASGDDLTLLSTAHATKGYVIFGSSQAIFDEVNTRFGIGATPLITLHATVSDASASSVSDVLRLEHIVAAAAGANNIGVGMLFAAESTTGGTQTDLVRLDAVATDASVAAVTAGFGISTRTGGGALTKRWVVSGAGHFVTGVDNSYDIGDPDAPLRPRHLTLSGRLRTNRGADVTAASTLTLGDDGNFFEILGTTTINHMTTTGWQVGSIVIFVFAATVTVTNNAATPPADTAPFFFSGGSSLSATAGDVLMLVLSDAGGTTAWTEVSRTII